MTRFLLINIFSLLVLVTVAQAYPNMVTRGYSNCIICHISPDGGGTLNNYGRNASLDLLSSAGVRGEEKALYGAVDLPDWLTLGGDFRALQLYQNPVAPAVNQGFVMQDDFEAAATYGKFTFDGTIGQQQDPDLNPPQRSLYSRRFYLDYQATDNVILRVGRYLNPYGINTPDHFISTKAGLGWDEGSESNNVAVGWMNDNVSAYLTGIFGRPDNPTAEIEKGVTFNTSVFIDNIDKVGFSYFSGNNDLENRQVMGPYAILGFTKQLYLLTETDFEATNPVDSSGVQKGVADYQRLGYEITQGFHIFGTNEYLQTNINDSTTILRTYGVGIQYFPRPHFELLAQWDKQQAVALSGAFYDFAYLLFHFYL